MQNLFIENAREALRVHLSMCKIFVYYTMHKTVILEDSKILERFAKFIYRKRNRMVKSILYTEYREQIVEVKKDDDIEQRIK